MPSLTGLRSLLFRVRGYATSRRGTDPRPRFDSAKGVLAANARALLVATCGTRPVVGPRVVDTAKPGAARFDECREGVTDGCRTHQESRNFQKHVSALCAAQTCNARNGISI
jgi:hypothetical protein